MSALPLLHLNSRNSPLKSRPATPVHSQNPACQSTKPRRPAPEPHNRSKSAPRPISVNSTRSKPTSKSGDDSQLAATMKSTLSELPASKPSNRKPTSKRSRKPREGTNSPSPAEQPVSHFYNLSFPEPQQSFIDSPDRMMNPSPTPRTAEPIMKSQALSYPTFATNSALRYTINPLSCLSPATQLKEKTSNRKTKKGGRDSEDVLTFDHLFSSHESPSEVQHPLLPKYLNPAILNGHTLILDDAQLASSPDAHQTRSTIASPNYHNRCFIT
ncbi:hypothetical protein PSTT_05498 [Puccinia striiformis]|uniref:Uncharacterized protein n=1 Tax=Puccinia striiformis TaxID=27350 RepID=A0A2S4VNG4_9BASI|nr:hypothetical protein PSTT_05498 [Puccinia striiformis]